MNPPDHRPSPSGALTWLTFAVSLALAWVLWPFFGAIMWGGVIAVLFTPLQRALLPRLGNKRTPTAALTLLLVLLIVVLPLSLLSAALADEAGQLYRRLHSGELNPALTLRGVFDALPAWLTALLDRFGLADFTVLQRRLVEWLAQASQFVATRMFSIGQITFGFVLSLFVTLYLAFFLLRDGDDVARALRRAIPLSPEHTQALLDTFATAIRATIRGSLTVAAVQGTLGGLAFWFLGVGAPLLWAVLMTLLSMLPAVGSSLVWLPVAIYFLLTGPVWKGVALIAYGVLVIGLVDNLLRPILVGKDTHLPDYLVLVTTLGGLSVLGLNGFIVGPTVAALFVAVWQIQVAARTRATPS